MVALNRFFTTGAGFVIFDRVATPISVTRLIQVRLSLRLMPSPHNLGLHAPDCSEHTPSRLHG
jgi:hypothetical protein